MSIDNLRQNQLSVKSHESLDHFDWLPAMVSLNVYITNDGHINIYKTMQISLGEKRVSKSKKKLKIKANQAPHYKGS